MAVTKKDQPDNEDRRGEGQDPAIRRPYDDEVRDPYEGSDVELRDPWEEGRKVTPLPPLKPDTDEQKKPVSVPKPEPKPKEDK